MSHSAAYTFVALYCITPDYVWHFFITLYLTIHVKYHAVKFFYVNLSLTDILFDYTRDYMIDGMHNCTMDGSAQQPGMAQWHNGTAWHDLDWAGGGK